MADEGQKAVETAELKTAGDVRDNLEDHNSGMTFEPLFDGEKVSEKDLLGETEPATEEKKADTSDPEGEEDKETKGAEKKPDETADNDAAKKAEEESKKAAEIEAAKKDEEKSKAEAAEKEKIEAATKPPPGFVPHEALQQARQKSQALKAENQSLRAEIEKLKVPSDSAPDRFKDFKVKTTDEYRHLLEEDSDAASLYLYEYNQFIDHQNKIQQQQTAEKQAKDAEKALIEDGASELVRVVPGFYTKGDSEASAMAQYAVDNGFEASVLYDLTNPATKITTATGEKYVLGPGAAQLVRFIKANLQYITKMPNEADLRKAIEADIRKNVEADLQKTLLEKLKTEHGFKSLDAATSSAEKTAKAIKGIVSESDFARLSELEQNQLLGG